MIVKHHYIKWCCQSNVLALRPIKFTNAVSTLYTSYVIVCISVKTKYLKSKVRNGKIVKVLYLCQEFFQKSLRSDETLHFTLYISAVHQLFRFRFVSQHCLRSTAHYVYMTAALTLQSQLNLTIANPTSAIFSAGASFVPSPVTATISRLLLILLSIIPFTNTYLSSGEDRANTLNFGQISSNFAWST